MQAWLNERPALVQLTVLTVSLVVLLLFGIFRAGYISSESVSYTHLLAESKGCSITTEKRSDKEFCVTITTENSIGKAEACLLYTSRCV